MPKLAVLASGSGTNFEAIASAIAADGRHEIVCLICDRKDAYAFTRAGKLDIASYYVSYPGRERAEAEREMADILKGSGADLIALAGFMRLLTPELLDRYPGKIINIHPSLLPKYPGTHGIEEGWESDDSELGITIHRVDHGLDTGPVIMQKSFTRCGSESLAEIETRIHQLEHQYYPEVLLDILDTI